MKLVHLVGFIIRIVYFGQMKSKQIKNSAPTYVKDSSHVHIHYPFNISSSRCLILLMCHKLSHKASIFSQKGDTQNEY
jgi:hypothetical protein